MKPPISGPASQPDDALEARVQALLARMSLAEKIDQMSGDQARLPGLLMLAVAYNTRPYPAGGNKRLDIPPLLFTDGPRGVAVNHATAFPVSIARGATWDPGLEERIGDAIGVEARTLGANFFAGVCVNVLRHPAWGRAQETYGEDPYHLGEMGAALVRGAQRHVLACVKHFAANSIELSRWQVDVQMDERTLREVYLPHFRRCVQEGVAAVMTAYNKLNGDYCGHHQHLLRDILKGEWGFEGLVMSDFVWGIRDTVAAAQAGCDVEMPFNQYYGRRLRQAVEQGQVSEAAINEAAGRILRQKLRFAPVGQPERYRPEAVAGPAHRALAREAAQKAMVLLKNEPLQAGGNPLLPLEPGRLMSLALIGRLAAQANIGDQGSSRVRPPHVVTPLEGLRTAAADLAILYHDGANLERAAAVARGAGAVVLVVGYDHRDEGEFMPYPWQKKGGDRLSLTLSAHDEALIQAVTAANPQTAVVLMGGSAIVTENWRAAVPAILMAWYPGMEGGHALADILFGKVNPSGKLPCIFPESAEQLPFFDNRAETISYDRYHGYRLLDRVGQQPAFPFGFGLSYTTFSCGKLAIAPDRLLPDGRLRVSLEVTNTGSRAGDEVIQLYIGCSGSRVDRPLKELKAFLRLSLEPGQTEMATFEVPAERLAFYDDRAGQWEVEPAVYRVFAGTSSAAADLLVAEFTIITP